MSKLLMNPFPLGVYVGNPNGSDRAAEASFEADSTSFSQLMGGDVQFIDAFVDQRQPVDKWIDNASWSAWSSALSPVAKAMVPVIALPMTSTAPGSPNPDQSYKNFASGMYDDVLAGMVKAWAKQGSATQYWRPGWEMNLASMPSYAGDDAGTQADWIKAFRHIYTVLHAAGTADGVNVQVIWNPGVINYSGIGVATKTVYPGSQYVDAVGADVYSDLSPYGPPGAIYDWAKNDGTSDTSLKQWAANPVNLKHYWTYPAATQWSLDGSLGHSLSLQDLIDFAKLQHKPLAVAETGAGSTGDGAGVADDPAFVQWLSSTLAASGVPVEFVNIWDSNGGGNYKFSSPKDGKPLEAAAWAQNFGSAASTGTAPVFLGSGPDTIVLRISEDAWMGDAQYTVRVDGTQVGETQTATAAHADGLFQSVSVSGNFGTGSHTLGITFLNDAYGGTEGTDRNIYVDQVAYAGRTATGTPATLLTNGSKTFELPGSATGTVITLHLAEDAWQGDARFSAAVDGTAIGQAETVTASNALGNSQSVVLNALLAVGPHDIAISFLNDAYGGTPSADRNLYVKGIDVNGKPSPRASVAIMHTQTDHFQLVVAAP